MALEVVAGTLKTFLDDKKEAESSNSLQPKDFFWDQFLKYIGSAVLALTVLNVSVEFLRGGGVRCFAPSFSDSLYEYPNETAELRDLTRTQSDYLNSFCTDSVPNSEFFPIFVLVQGILLVAPHFIWSAVFKHDFDSFFAVTEKLHRLRDKDSGEYDSTNFNRVEKLELEFGRKRKRIFTCYILKLFLQLAVCVGTVLFSELFFDDFNFSFQCPRDVAEEGAEFPKNWPLNSTIPCVFSTIRVLNLVRYGDYLLVGLAMFLIVMGLVWCAIRHTKELGHSEIANFMFRSCLPMKSHVFPNPFEVRLRKNMSENCWFCMLPFALLWPSCKGCIVCSFRFMAFSPRIQNDLDFLQMTLFRADSSHGRVFKEIQIDKELQKLHGRDHQLIHLFLNVQLDMEALMEKRERKKALGGSNVAPEASSMRNLPREIDMHQFFREGGFSTNPEMYAFNHYRGLLGNTELQQVVGIRDRLYGFVRFCPKVNDEESGEEKVNTDLAMDISFGSKGYGLVLARAFKDVVSVTFQPFLNNAKEPVKKIKFYTNYMNVNFPENIFTRSSEDISMAVREMLETMKEEGPDRPVDFILVGPIDDDNKKITVTLQIEMLYTVKVIEKEAILLTVRPLKIGRRKTTKQFLRYEPPVELFDHSYHEREVLPKLRAEAEPHFRTIDGFTGITINCGDIECVFEFMTYQYIGQTSEDDGVSRNNLSTSESQHTDIDDHNPDNDRDGGHANTSCNAQPRRIVQDESSHTETDDTNNIVSPPPLRTDIPVGSDIDFSRDPVQSLQHQGSFQQQGAPRMHIQEGGVYDWSTLNQSTANQTHPPPLPQGGGAHNIPEAGRKVYDFSPRAREKEMKMKRSASSRRRSLRSSGSSGSTTSDNRAVQRSTSHIEGQDSCTLEELLQQCGAVQSQQSSENRSAFTTPPSNEQPSRGVLTHQTHVQQTSGTATQQLPTLTEEERDDVFQNP